MRVPRDLAKRGVTLIAIHRNPVLESDREVVAAVVVVIACGAADGVLRDVNV